jgi:hypothetical protein
LCALGRLVAAEVPSLPLGSLEAEPFGRGSVAETADTAPSVVRPRPEPLSVGPMNLHSWSDCFGHHKPLSSGNRIPSPWVRWPRPHRLGKCDTPVSPRVSLKCQTKNHYFM